MIVILPLPVPFWMNDPDTLLTGQMLKLWLCTFWWTLKKCEIFFYYLQNFSLEKLFSFQEENFVWRWFWRETQNISNLKKIKPIFKGKNKIYFVWYKYCKLGVVFCLFPCLFLFACNIFFIPSLLVILCLSKWSESLIGSILMGLLFFYPFSHLMSFD